MLASNSPSIKTPGISWSINRSFFESFCQICVIIIMFAIPLSNAVMYRVMGIFAASCLLSPRIRQRAKLLWNNPVSRIIIILYSFFILASFYSPVSEAEIWNGLHQYDKFLAILLFIPFLIDEKIRKYIFIAFNIAMIITLVFSFLKYYDILNITPEYSLAAPFKSRIDTSFILAFTGFYWLHEAKNNSKWRWMFSSLSLATVYNIFFMNSGRTGYVIVAALLILFLYQQWGGKGLVISLVSVLALFFTAFQVSTMFHNRVTEVTQDIRKYETGQQYTSTGLRLVFWKNTFDLLKEKPMLGYGTGSFKSIYQDTYHPSTQFQTKNPHNDYLFIGFQLGIPGIILLMMLFLSQWLYSLRLDAPYKILLQAIVVSYSIGGLINSSIYDTTTGYFFAMITALCIAAGTEAFTRKN